MRKNYIIIGLIILSAFKVNAQQSRIDSVIVKLQKDNRSFKEYILLGKMNCYGKIAGLENEIDGNSVLYFNMWANLYNSLSPFTRLLNKESIEKSITEYFQLHNEEFKAIDTTNAKNSTKESTYYEKIELCNCLFSKKSSYKKQYLNLIRQKKSFIYTTNEADSFSTEEIESFMKDYLDGYFIKIQTE
jgi:hypothetical protein